MREAATIVFTDHETNGEALVVVRYNDKQVAISLSIKGDGDIEVVLDKKDAALVKKALEVSLK